MITCPRCHHHNPDEALHCELCGASLAPARSPLPPEADETGDFLDELEPVEIESMDSMEPLEGDGPDEFRISAGPQESPRLPQRSTAGGTPALSATGPQNSGEQPAGLARLLHDALSGPSEEKPVFGTSTRPGLDPARVTNPVLKPVPSLPSASKRERDQHRGEELSNQELSDFLLDALSTAEPLPSAEPISLEPLSSDADSSLDHGLQASAPHGSIKCGTCNRSNPEGMLYCVYCGASLEDQNPASGTSLPSLDIGVLKQEVNCSSCHHANPAGNQFCGNCGAHLKVADSLADEPRVPSGGIPALQRQASPWDVRLVSINEDGSDGLEIPLEHVKTIVGRTGDTRFPTDAFLSPKHACLTVEHGELHVEDLYSLNGTFLRLRDEVALTAGDVVLMGRQVLRFEKFEQTITPKARSSDGTRYMGSPLPGGHYKLLQVGIGGVIQNVYCIPDSGAVLGREKGDIIFPRDKFMSGRHAQIYPREDNTYCLVDLNSSNGTWIKIWERTQLRHNDYIFMGQQLFRIHIKDK